MGTINIAIIIILILIFANEAAKSCKTAAERLSNQPNLATPHRLVAGGIRVDARQVGSAPNMRFDNVIGPSDVELRNMLMYN